MTGFEEILDHFQEGFFFNQLSTPTIVAVLLMVTILSVYEFLVYRFVSKRTFYSKQFNMAMAIIPYFIATIILALQSNLVITLGTIGALAIIRFRTAIKDPMDMIYLLWSVHTGITCGAAQYELAILTSLSVTILLILLNLLPVKKAPYLLIIQVDDIQTEKGILTAIGRHAKHTRIKSRNVFHNGMDMIVELSTNHETALLKDLNDIQGVARLSLISHDGESII